MISYPGDTPVDLGQLRSHTEGDVELEREVIGLFKSVAEGYTGRLEQAVADGGKPWGETAHAFKGAAANIGARQLSGLLAQAESLTDVPVQERRAALDALRAEYQRVVEYLDRLHD